MAHLKLQNLRKLYGSAIAVHDFSLDIEKGSFVTFLGPSGCGKTTTLRMIAGFELPSSGSILLADKDITYNPPNQRHVGMVFQSYALFPNMTVADNIGFGLKLAKVSKAEITQRVAELLGMIHLPELGGRYPHQLSGGQQQRVALARALAIRPDVLLLDEPLSALDAKIRLSLRMEIRQIQQQLGITTVYVTHDQEEAMSLSDRIVVMNKGNIEQVGPPAEVYNQPKTAFAASFVGTLNLLNGHIADASGGKVRYDGQIFDVGHPLTAELNSPITLALRPETLDLDPAEGDNHLTGIVELVMFLGSIVRLTVLVGEQRLMMDTFNERTLKVPKVGETVTVYFPPEACLVLNPEAEQH
ncbi:MAG: ABC transporter ATP-binding protein [Ardenticatenales bacterium]|nr:ABC transporter ATP-binding protein [Ardenticatenales bacterium]